MSAALATLTDRERQVFDAMAVEREIGIPSKALPLLRAAIEVRS